MERYFVKLSVPIHLLVLTWVLFNPGCQRSHSPIKYSNDQFKAGVCCRAIFQEVACDYINVDRSRLQCIEFYHFKLANSCNLVLTSLKRMLTEKFLRSVPSGSVTLLMDTFAPFFSW